MSHITYNYHLSLLDLAAHLSCPTHLSYTAVTINLTLLRIRSSTREHKVARTWQVACTRYNTQEALFNFGLHVNLITLAHLSYFPTNKCKATRQKT